MYKAIISLLLLSNITNAQVTARIFNSSDKSPIPYVNIWIENAKGGTTADENGRFKMNNTNEKSKLIFTAVGFKKKTLEFQTINDSVFLDQEIYNLNEVVVHSKKNMEIKIGKLKNSNLQYYVASDKDSYRTIAKYFSHDTNYKQTLFVKTIRIKTMTSLENPILNLQFYSLGLNGEPKNYLYDKNILCPVKKGKQTTDIDVSDLNIEFPETGLFVVLENLMLEQNKNEEQYQYSATETRTFIIYEPGITMLESNGIEDTWAFNGTIWRKNNNGYTISMEVILSN